MGMQLPAELERKCLELAGLVPSAPVVPVDLDAGEKEFQDDVVRAAKRHGWLAYHTYSSKRSVPGFPDLVLVRNTVLAFAELKTNAGKLTAEQKDWLAAIKRAGLPGFVWRPSDWAEIERFLTEGT